MIHNVATLISRGLLLLVVIALVAARPQHFGESNQVNSEQEAPSNMIGSPGLTNMQLELLAQRLAEYNNQIPSEWERIVRAPEIKRQSRFRQCYFNPVSCFKK